MKKLVISVLMVSLLAACSSSKPPVPVAESKQDKPADVTSKDEARRPSTSTSESGSESGSASTSASTSTDKMEVDPLNDSNGLLAKRSTYYPFDVYVVQDADKPVVQAHANYLSEHANRNVRLEGNCDERGSNEYNLGLGQRRADGVKKMLVVGGAKDSQIETVSYGEEKPRATDHDEASWAQNRRTDLNYNVR